jgi:plasmid stabilization system protein ParE
MPARYGVHVMPEASADLARAFEYIGQDSPQNAASVLNELFAAIDSLELLPHRHKVHRSNRNLLC